MLPRTLTILLALVLGAPAWGAGDDEACAHALARAVGDPARAIPGFDEGTGRDARHYPPNRTVDFRHMRLAIDIPDMNRPHLSAVQTLSFTPIAVKLSELTLDAHLLDIKRVESSGRTATFASDSRTITITFEPPVPPGTEAELVTTYEVDDPPQGLTWTPESPAWPKRPAQLHSQGEAETNSYWFPCHDFPNERLTTELVVTVPDGLMVSGNGRLVEPPTASGSNGTKRLTWHWLQDKPHVNYLVSLVVGRFDMVDVAAGRGKGAVPMPVYVPPGLGKDVARTYGRTPEMVDLFGRLTGRAYPWDRYAQVVVWNFGAGGMENTSATTLYDTAVLSAAGLADGDLEGLISHELAHQWFGDLITCKSWEHIWLNEGFATYFTSLWMEGREKDAGARLDAYQAGILGNFDSVLDRDKADAPFQPPMVSKAYNDPGDTFGRAANPYPKGASILHMLRVRLGDEVFFRGLAGYVDRGQLQTVETSDFRKAMEEASGDSLEQFFSQWCYRPGVPDLTVEMAWDEPAHELAVTVNQTQKIDGYNPAFAFNLPIWFDTGGRGAGVPPAIEVRGKTTSARFKLDREPAVVAVDPGLAVLARYTIKQPTARWVAQLERGPTLASRIQAARALADDASPESRSALLSAAAASRAYTRLRSVAIESLRKRNSASALNELAAGAARMPADVRVTLVESIASLAADSKTEAPDRALFTQVLARHAATEEPSFRARAAALRALGKLKATAHLNLLLAAADAESQHDRVRQGALEALGDMDARQGLPIAIRYALPGAYNRTRPTAIQALRKLAHHDPEAAYATLAALLTDRERRAWESAGEALAALGDSRAAADFQKLASAKRDESDKKKIAAWEEKVTKHAAR